MILVLLLAACREDDPPSDSSTGLTDDSAGPTDPDAPHLSDLQADLFTPTCATALCHSAAQASGGLVLEEGRSWASLVNVPSTEITSALRVRPGASVNSYLVLKLEAAPGIEGVPMPFGARLDPTAITPVRYWIDAGAVDN